MLRNRIETLAFLRPLTVLMLLTGCATAPVVPPPPRTVTVTVPRITPLPQTTETQTRGGISLTLAPTSFEAEAVPACSYGFVTGTSALFVRMPPGVSQQTHTQLSESRFTRFEVAPPDLGFVLTVRNQMDRVFRGAGAVVQFNIDGRAQGVDQSNYSDFIDALITPRGEAQIRLLGPPLSALPEGSTLGIFLYDVVTEADNAGNVVSRENFEWYFNVSYDSRAETVQVTNRNVWVPNDVARTVIEATADGGARIISRPGDPCLRGAVSR